MNDAAFELCQTALAENLPIRVTVVLDDGGLLSFVGRPWYCARIDTRVSDSTWAQGTQVKIHVPRSLAPYLHPLQFPGTEVNTHAGTLTIHDCDERCIVQLENEMTPGDRVEAAVAELKQFARQ